jgi:hypothetical protein
MSLSILYGILHMHMHIYTVMHSHNCLTVFGIRIVQSVSVDKILQLRNFKDINI